MKTPTADRKVLVLLAGILWSTVGLILTGVAAGWLASAHRNIIFAAVLTFFGGAILHRFGFSILAAINLTRIYRQAPGKDKVCVFAFQDTRSYVIIAVMILLGYTLRHLPIPKFYLAPVYGTIGLGLFLSSLVYYRYLACGGA